MVVAAFEVTLQGSLHFHFIGKFDARNLVERHIVIFGNKTVGALGDIIKHFGARDAAAADEPAVLAQTGEHVGLARLLWRQLNKVDALFHKGQQALEHRCFFGFVFVAVRVVVHGGQHDVDPLGGGEERTRVDVVIQVDIIRTEWSKINQLKEIVLSLDVGLAANADDAPHVGGGQQLVAVLLDDLPVHHCLALVGRHLKRRQREQRLLFFHIKIYFDLGEKPRGLVVIEHVHQHVVPLRLVGNGLFDICRQLFLVDGAVLVGKAHDQPVADKRRQIQLGKQLGIGRRFAHEHVAKAGAEPLLKGQDGCVFCIHWFHP